MNERADVVVIGGGPAGSAAAIELARSGASVVLLERERAVRAKVCGEFVSVEACAAARALGVDFDDLGAAPIDRVRVTSGGARASAALPFRAASLSRERFDAALLAAAEAAGAAVRMATRATALSPGAVACRSGEDARRIACDHVVIATGKTEFGERRERTRADAVGFKMHYAMPDAALQELATSVDLALFSGGYAGMQRIEDGRVAFACAVASQPPGARAWPALLAALARTAPRLAALLATGRALWPKPLAVAGVPYGFVYRGTDDANAPYRAGDAFAVIPSFTGDGIAIALVTGREAAAAISRGETAAVYHAAMRARVARPMRVAGTLAAAIRTPIGRAAVVWPARIVPQILSGVAALTRISD